MKNHLVVIERASCALLICLAVAASPAVVAAIPLVAPVLVMGFAGVVVLTIIKSNHCVLQSSYRLCGIECMASRTSTALADSVERLVFRFGS